MTTAHSIAPPHVAVESVGEARADCRCTQAPTSSTTGACVHIHHKRDVLQSLSINGQGVAVSAEHPWDVTVRDGAILFTATFVFVHGEVHLEVP
ncbi:hypothetical protein JT358_11700 [Micrococcales bacterium 31B]|nr:hypothetical protein [Micrococcales bacterium 31B]